MTAGLRWPRQSTGVVVVGSERDPIELTNFETLDAICSAATTVVVAIASQYRILACKYLHARVPSADLDEVMLKVEAITDQEKRRS